MFSTLFYIFLLVVTWFLHSLFAISGLGGGIVLVPAYISLGIAVSVAATAGLLMNIISLSLVTVHNADHKIVRWKLGTFFLIPALLMSPIGEIASSHVVRNYVVVIFIALLVYAFIHVMLKRKPSHRERITGSSSLIIAVPVGVIAGFLSGLTGIGGGLIILPALTFMEDDYKKIAGTTAYVALFISAASFLSHIGFLTLFTPYFWAVILIGSIAGGITASFLIHFLKSESISKITGGVILVMIGILIYSL